MFHPPVAGDTAIVSGEDAQGNLIQLAGLILGANASINNGGFVVGTITMNGGQGGGTTTFNGSGGRGVDGDGYHRWQLLV